MSSRKLSRLLLAFVIGVGSEPCAWAVDLAAAPQAPISTAAKPRIAQTAQPAAKPVSMQVGSAAPGALPGAAPATLWRFMGIPQGIRKMQGATRNRNGNRPNREPRPPLKAIADPANLDPGNGPAINKAAEIKQKEDLAPQKIKALKYLATIGCGCYPGVEEALAKSLKFGDECTEEVRYEAALAIQDAALSNCAKCGKSCCCTAEMMQLLNDVATGRDADGCFFEPSARVREAACQALLACRARVRVYPAPPASEPYVPAMPGETIPREPLPGEFVPKDSSASSSRQRGPNDALMNDILGAGEGGGVAASPVSNRKSVSQGGGDASRPAPTRATLVGSVVGIDAKTATVDLEFQGNRQPTVGSQFSVHHDYALNSVYQGRVEVVYLARNGRAIAKPVGRVDFAKLGKGDRVTGRITGGDETAIPVGRTIRSSSRPSCVAPPEGHAIPQPPAESPKDSTTAAPMRPAHLTQMNAVPAKAAEATKKTVETATPHSASKQSESNIGKHGLGAAQQAKSEPLAKAGQPQKSLVDSLTPWKKSPPAKVVDAQKQSAQPSKKATGKTAGNVWQSAVPAKGSTATQSAGVLEPSKNAAPHKANSWLTGKAATTTSSPSALAAKYGVPVSDRQAPETGLGFEEESPRWTDSLFKKIKPKKQAVEPSALENIPPPPDLTKRQAPRRQKSASPITSAWSRLTRPEAERLHPSPVAPAAATSDGQPGSVAGVVLMEE